jgi:NAD(P)-dependent dehydrogenase (short-subunit alcohol dehydrogenase family)
MSRFDQKVAIITGAASGIGREIALRFAAEGGTPVIADLNIDAADAAAREVKAPESKSSSRSWISRLPTGNACWRSISTAPF